MERSSAGTIVMLTGLGEFPEILYHELAQPFDVLKVIVEAPVPRNIFIKRRIKRLGILKVLGQLAFMVYDALVLKPASTQRIADIKNSQKFNDAPIKQDLVVKVDSVNSDAAINLLREQKPDVVVVLGTRIIHQRILSSIDSKFINIHSGITPKYRGVHGGYWALAVNDAKNCGVTVHLVDSGIDTGGVLYQSHVEITKDDNFNTYPYLQLGAAIPLMIQAIKDIAGQQFTVKEVDLPSKLWSHPTIFQYLRARLLNGVK